MYFFFLFSYISLLYTGLVTIIIMTYIVLYFLIYDDDVCFFHLPLHVLFLFSLYSHGSLCTQSLFMFHT